VSPIRNNLIITILVVLFSLILINSVTAISILPDNWVDPNSQIPDPDSLNTTTNISENTTPDPEIEPSTTENTTDTINNETKDSEIITTSAATQKIISNSENPSITNSTDYPIIETNEVTPNSTENSDNTSNNSSSVPYVTLILSVILGGTLIMLKK